jgi:hypothetical protein
MILGVFYDFIGVVIGYYLVFFYPALCSTFTIDFITVPILTIETSITF